MKKVCTQNGNFTITNSLYETIMKNNPEILLEKHRGKRKKNTNQQQIQTDENKFTNICFNLLMMSDDKKTDQEKRELKSKLKGLYKDFQQNNTKIDEESCMNFLAQHTSDLTDWKNINDSVMNAWEKLPKLQKQQEEIKIKEKNKQDDGPKLSSEQYNIKTSRALVKYISNLIQKRLGFMTTTNMNDEDEPAQTNATNTTNNANQTDQIDNTMKPDENNSMKQSNETTDVNNTNNQQPVEQTNNQNQTKEPGKKSIFKKAYHLLGRGLSQGLLGGVDFSQIGLSDTSDIGCAKRYVSQTLKKTTKNGGVNELFTDYFDKKNNAEDNTQEYKQIKNHVDSYVSQITYKVTSMEKDLYDIIQTIYIEPFLTSKLNINRYYDKATLNVNRQILIFQNNADDNIVLVLIFEPLLPIGSKIANNFKPLANDLMHIKG